MRQFSEFARNLVENKLRMGPERVGPNLKKALGPEWMKDLIGYDFTDKGFSLQFKTKVTKKELSKKLGVQDFMIDDDGNNTFTIAED